MKYLAIDWGTKRIGLALSDDDGQFAQRIDPIIINKSTKVVSEIVNLIEQHKVDSVLYGLPLGLASKPTQSSKEVNKLIKALSTLLSNKTFIPYDETNSSNQARSSLRNKKLKNASIDSEAARMMLQEYLDFIFELN